ncbi:MAG: SpoIIE family protein phosphatase [Eubacteriales bacterium]|nr:SpoIIE family protein phosphatase [Eubacteriales bacterium]
MNVSLVYLIQVDRSDYGRFVSVFNSVNNSVDDTEYTPWELGHKRNTTNDEYRRKYQALYEGRTTYETLYRTQTTDGQHPHITTLVPVRNTAGDVVGILCVQRPIRELADARRPYLINIAVFTVLLAAAVSVFYAIYIRKQFIIPLTKVSKEATRFAQENVKGESLVSISKFKEIRNLGDSVDTMETDMLNYIENLTAITAEKERIGAELSLASTIQENSVPNIFPPFPERTDFDIYASMTPAKEVGGDFYNFFLIDEDHLAMVIGDVSGKGIPAALFMMVTNILISDRAHMGGTPAEILAFVNHNLCAHNKADMFVTIWLGILELSTGMLTASNAGHEYPAFKHPGVGFELLKDKHGMALGAMDAAKYKDYTVRLEPGTKLFIYTDGVPEATDGENRMFGLERMTGALNEAADATPGEVLKSVRRAVDGFVQGAEQFDDLTMLCMEFKELNQKQ